MAKEKEKVEIRPVDEDAESKLRYVRLHKDVVEEVEELPPVKVGVVPTALRQDAASREELKTRSNEPDLSSLIEREAPVADEPWEERRLSVKSFPWGWVALAGCVFTGAILWSLVNVNRGGDKRQALLSEAAAIREKDRSEEMDAESLINALEAVVRDFFDSRSVEELLRYVRHPERVRPLLESHYAGKAPVATRVESILSLDPLTLDRYSNFWMISCKLDNGVQTQLLVETVSAKEAKVDWETYVCYQPMAWDEFAVARPEGYTGDFRVYVERDHFFSHEFSDPETFGSFRLTALNGDMVLFGYAPRGSGAEQRITELIEQHQGGTAPMILRLHVPKGIASPRGVLIQELINPRWAFVNSPGKKEP